MEMACKAYLRLGFEGRELPKNVAFSGNAWVLEEKHRGRQFGAGVERAQQDLSKHDKVDE